MLCAALLLACAGVSAQGGATPTGPSFALDVRAPAPVKALLERHLELRRYREVSDLDDAELARLVTLAERNVRELVGTLGYFNPRIAISRQQASGHPVIVVDVTPGERTQVDKVAIGFAGDIQDNTSPDVERQRATIRSGWTLPPRAPFTQAAWDAAKAQATRDLVARRYLNGHISASEADIDAATGRAALAVTLDSGPVFHLGGLKVNGVERYDAVLVPRLARLPAGSEYDQDAILQAQLRLAGSGYFDSAFILVDPEADPNAAPVQVTVREAALHKVVLGVGVSTDSGPRASIEYDNNRVPVIGWRAINKLQLERKQPFASTEWTAIPGEDGWRWGVLARAERIDDGTLVTHAQRLRAGQSWLGDHIERNVYVQYDRANVQAAPGVLATIPDTGDGAALSVNYVWAGKYFDSTPYPSRGYGVGAEFGGGYTLTGSRSPFQRTVLRWLGIRPLGDGRLQLRAQGGAVFASSQARVPADQLFRTGGDTTVRGYGFREIGVERGNVVGPGRYLAVGSVEYQKPFLWNGLPTAWESVLFVDGGAVSDRVVTLKPVFGTGVGARWKSPLGPVEIDLAYGVQPKKLRLHFNLGFNF